MKIFLTKVWGWDVPVGPLQFSTSGWRDNALRQLEDGDRVVLVGTTGDQTPDDMKGRLLGVMEPSREPVMSLDFDLRARSDDFVDGEYKWPVGLMNLRAWSLPERPKLNQISERKFSMDSAQGVVPLADDEAARLLALDWREEALMQPTAQAQARMAKKHGAAKRTAPPPTTTRRASCTCGGHRPTPTSCGSLVLDLALSRSGGRSTSSSGHGGSITRRCPRSEVWNRFHLWDTAQEAYTMEQALLAHLSDRLHPDNGEIITGLSDDDLDAAWLAGVSGKL